MGGPEPQWDLVLLGEWRLCHGERSVEVAPRQQRLIAVLGLYGDRSRMILSDLLWGDRNESQAMGSLRASVWQIRQKLPGVLEDDNGRLGLAAHVDVDIHALYRGVDGISERTDERELLRLLDLLEHAVLLPTWSEQWVVAQRERLQQVRLKGFEALAHQFIVRHALPSACAAAQAAVDADPMRETAQRLLAQTHIANGDLERAVQVYRHFRSSCLREFGLEPSERFARLIEDARTRLGGDDRPPQQ